ncbi:lysine--tRNA ligase [Legionella oakridgensis]|uniref:Lysine--tRNA ligase n=2 Tax=Legionella oakridgensis TaxID=29423 RepID=W0BGF3_9GAMM|nr:lysine--tRNA ligase [Legionella oakridgensis]AHE67702.1 lysyl-tRNA synthetase class II [Legionella oakridgensis ATCC 33761 = DSM 21215]ETO92742.1 lysyl-tRNA synthetase, class II [Legionella oakridgensis RV-2-2007]KTD36965.1 lysine tRNA synthetase [Legionella oakridgensis]STY20726.1 lysyl-tRNA synthetase, class II [Legionella longbeachae]
MIEEHIDESEVYQIRKQKLAQLREKGFNFPNQFQRQHLAQDLMEQYGETTKEDLADKHVNVVVAGRIVLRRIMGKASFFHIQDVSGRLQIYVRQNDVPEIYEQFKHWDLGDIVGIRGELFKTNTGELTVHAEHVELLTKSLRPLPDKFHGLADQEMRYRKRYVDLIANEESRKVFLTRSHLIRACRQFMDGHQFLEVETPMMHPIPGGALARPFITHHNTLAMQMFLRIAPELYLKRLVVGGFERVYEINRNFRNEGISTRHNPEFTMMEFYEAYATYHDLMDFTEELLRFLCDEVVGSRQIEYQGQVIDFTKPFLRMSIKEAILKFHPELQAVQLETIEDCRVLLDKFGFAYKKTDGLGKLQMILFEETVEHQLIQPTFITEYPTEVSPLARCNEINPEVTDRFEFFIAGREIANGFSELNDPDDQAVRFQKQVEEKEAGDLEAMHYDSDYIEALEYGMPPTAGEGIGIDRLVMLFTDSPSIRDVILFPHLRISV